MFTIALVFSLAQPVSVYDTAARAAKRVKSKYMDRQATETTRSDVTEALEQASSVYIGEDTDAGEFSLL